MPPYDDIGLSIASGKPTSTGFLLSLPRVSINFIVLFHVVRALIHHSMFFSGESKPNGEYDHGGRVILTSSSKDAMNVGVITRISHHMTSPHLIFAFTGSFLHSEILSVFRSLRKFPVKANLCVIISPYGGIYGLRLLLSCKSPYLMGISQCNHSK